jgi:hypothetical protein
LWNNPKQRDIWSQFLELLQPWGKPKSIVIYVIIKCTEEQTTYQKTFERYDRFSVFLEGIIVRESVDLSINLLKITMLYKAWPAAWVQPFKSQRVQQWRAGRPRHFGSTQVKTTTIA